MAGPQLVQKLEELVSDEDLHWFCPRAPGRENGVYFDEDVDQSNETDDEKQKRLVLVQEAHERRDKALEVCIILAFDGADALDYQEKLKASLQKQLIRCDICVREFHRGRRLLRNQLESEYPADDVLEFMKTFDTMNEARIIAGLDSMTEHLIELPEEQRRITSAGQVGMFGLFESLHCIPFLRNEAVLERSFDPAFQLVLGKKKKLIVPNYAPAMAAFLYNGNQERQGWAERNITRNGAKRKMLSQEFDSVVKPWLEPAMARVHPVALEGPFLPRFWKGTRLLLMQLTPSIMTDNLRSMDANLFQLALDHFQIDSPHFADLLGSVHILLESCGLKFWDAVGAMTPQYVAEQIFKSPGLNHLLQTRTETEPLRLEEKMAWVDALIRSVKPANLVTPLRTLLDQLLKRIQNPPFSNYASSVAWEKGLVCLLDAIELISQAVDGGPVYTHLIETVSNDHLTPMLQELGGIEKKSELQLSKTEQLDLDIISKILELEVKSMTRDHRYIQKTNEIDHVVGHESKNLWKKTTQHIKAGHGALPTAVLSGIKGLIQLEPFIVKKPNELSPAKSKWNEALRSTRDNVTGHLIYRLDQFSPDQLAEIYFDPPAARGIMALLFSGDEQVHQGALSILKTLTSEDSRRDCLMHVTTTYYTNTLDSASEVLTLISTARIFTPSKTLMKLCRDILDCLCNSQDGLLRKTTLSSEKDQKTLRKFWLAVWKAISTIFEMTEAWSAPHDKTMMMDFCRDVMDFAEYAFDQYAVIAGTLETSQRSQLLHQPRVAFINMIKYLRLRDDWLIEKAVLLTCRMLSRLQDSGIQARVESIQYLHGILQGNVKTKLSMQHKAELQRALESHTGESSSGEEDISDISKRKKQSSLQTWAKSGSGASTPTTTSKPSKNVIDLESWSSKAAAQKEQVKKPLLTAKEKQKVVNKNTVVDQANFLAKRKATMAEQQKQKELALAKAKASGAGSGVLGLGNYAADHDTKGQTIMVDSDEEESEDDDLDDDLFGTTTTKPKRQIRPDLDLSGAVGLKPEVKSGPTKIARTNRSLKDMRARLKPDLGPLHRLILSWDFFHEGDYPPQSNEHEFSRVENAFRDPTSYQQTFEPLLTLEAWQGMVKAREELRDTTKPYEIKVQNRSNVDQFLEVSSFLGHQENRDLQLSEGDIVLFSKGKKPATDESEPHCLARVYRVKRQKAHLEIVYQVMPGSSMAAQLTMQSIVYGLKLQSITPLEREYGALKGLVYYDLCNQIVRAKPSQKINFSDRQVSSFRDIYELNRAQAEAVNGALENEGFSLIQGPPGSGKTKTIVAIVGGLLTQVLKNTPRGAQKISMPAINGQTSPAGDAPSKKLLVCAPSNAAVDELVMRLMKGVKTKDSNHHDIKVVRIGRSEAISAQVSDVTMETLVQQKLGGSNAADEKQRKMNAELFKEHSEISAQLRDLYQKRDSEEDMRKLEPPQRKELDDEITHVRRRKAELGQRIDSVKDNEKSAGREQELNRKRAQQAVLDEAHVICATLSGSGHDMFSGLSIEFETVVIDEAAQCVEMSSLIPLKYGCVKCVMVGDPKQLPPTVFSKEAAKFQYEQSLFVRMQNNHPGEVHLLDTQYRMHPDISVFPSRTFYDSLLKDGPSMASLRKQPWHASSLLAPYRFFDVAGQHSSAPRGNSLVNKAEIDVALMLYVRLRTDFPTYDFTGKIGIIVTYKAQLREMKSTFISRFGQDVTDFIEFNTTDAFQGRESEIIIFSCVRASPSGTIGFLQDIRRMNVGLTRAKSSLWVLGNASTLSSGQYWKKLVEDARGRDNYTTGDLKKMLNQSSKNFPAKAGTTRTMDDAPAAVEQAPMDGGISSGKESHIGGGVEDKMITKSRIAEMESAQEADKMDGVRYRFEDRVGKKKAEPKPSTQDVEMEDADLDDEYEPAPATHTNGTAKRGSLALPNALTTNKQESRESSKAPGDAVRPKSGTPASRDATPASDASKTNSGAASTAPSIGQQVKPPPKMVKKRPAAPSSMFMPKRKPGQR
ncbi:Putative helicase Sen1, P-loop containing nucleoside triphosphate hydrolase, DNA2/NAM7 helicase [Septoria linicola]|uniref:Helicase Sen1, P-loop containing nucleoside triphosphate hydrolase, DNA2/NAM7 helicase n=1 Tax=Septoria linicola TaxID=215465 RepID=A0A9Q9AIV4_9PEZI|nr:putative helicase Sen1, P-loop containing nucleoside triphosphate hydrolase, DNA2/NAM7 helicase [Septoria linicola]USW46993.1 Putative helicase Sen1, P-loop containing nucleoside triphosphate hydrolase, DNA2/NAM7 helicase [Septoria linicola]